jgi:antitoxin ParD1/3/4
MQVQGTGLVRLYVQTIGIYSDVNGGGWMPRNTSVLLGDHFAKFVDAQVGSGRYGSASDVVRAGLRLLESHESQMRVLQEALRAGEASGEPTPFDSEALLARMQATRALK